MPTLLVIRWTGLAVSGEALFATAVLGYSAFPFLFASLRSPFRVVLFYVYIGVVLAFGGLLGAIHSFPVSDGITISAGSVAYGALMTSSLMLVIVVRDLSVFRNIVRLVVVVNVFTLLLFALVGEALESSDFPNPNETSPAVFDVSIRGVVAGGILIVFELMVLLAIFEFTKRRIASRALLSAIYVTSFVGVICLDGVLFPLLALPLDLFQDVVPIGVHSKLIVALAYSVPLGAFLLLFRQTITAYDETPLRLQELVIAPRDDLIHRIESQRIELRLAEDTIAAREDWYRSLIQNSADVTAVVDRDGMVTYLNPAGVRLLGLPSAKREGLVLLEITHPDDHPVLASTLQHLVDGAPSVQSVRIRLRDDRGHWRWIESALTNCLHDPAVEGVVVNGRDVTDTVDAEHARDALTRVNELISVTTERSELLGEVSRAIVEAGGYAEAWVTTSSRDDHRETARYPDAPGDASPVPATSGTSDGSSAESPTFEVSVPADDEMLTLAVRNEPAAALAAEATTFLAQVGHTIARALSQMRHDQLRSRSLQETISALAAAAEMRDPYTGGHQRRVAELAAAIATEMGLDENRIQGITIGAAIHDIGKIAIPSELLTRSGRLSTAEFALIKEHARTGSEILGDIEFLWPIRDMVLHHHERLDGSGYPDGLEADEIILDTRIVAVSDVVEAMSSHRPYRPALGIEAALAEVRRGAGRLYDADVVAACIAVLDDGFTFTAERA